MEKIKNYIIKNPLFVILNVIVSLFFAGTVFMDHRLAFSPDIYAPMEKIFFYPANAKSIFLGLLAFISLFTIITLLGLFQNKYKINYTTNMRTADKKDYYFWIFSFILLICAWSPYYLSYFPGGIYPDTIQSLSQAVSNTYNNQQPILYAFILKLCVLLAGEQCCMTLFTVLQITFMAGCFSYVIFRLRLHNVNKLVVALALAYFALFNLVPLYVVSLWKDTLFSATLLMYIFLLSDCIILNESKVSPKDLFSLISFMVLTIFLRNNGLYIIIATTVILCVVFRKSILGNLRSFIISSFSAIIICFIIQGPVFNSLHLNGPFVENLGVMQQQLSYSMLNGGDFTDDDFAFLCQIMPFDDIGNRDYYRPFNIDSTKWSEKYNSAFLEEHKTEFLRIWAKSFTKNPRLFLNAYLYSTLGYWDAFKQLDISYTNQRAWEENQNDPRFIQKDYIYEISGSSIRDTLSPSLLISSAALFFITLVLFVLCTHKKNKSWVAFIPALMTYLTVFIATPLAFALRYVYILVLTLPLFIIYVFIREE